MNEVRLFAVVLTALLVAAYLSWTQPEEDQTAVKQDVTVWDVELAALERIQLVTTTQTVTISRIDAPAGGDPYPFFELDRRGKKTVFVGNDQATKLLGRFAPLKALRSLGRKLTGETLEQTGLPTTKQKLTVVARGKTRVYAVGKRTHGARDFYVRAEDGDEVFLLPSASVGDLLSPKSKYMQRNTKLKPLKEVGGVQLVANGQTISAKHNNRSDPEAAFWAFEGEDQPNEALASFIMKVHQLTVFEYPQDTSAFDSATPMLQVTWTDDDGKPLFTTVLAKDGEGPQAKYFVRSDRTVRPGTVAYTAAEIVESDLASLLK